MSTVITRQYEQWCSSRIISEESVRPDTFIFALVPDQDEAAEISRDEGLPDASLIKHRAPVTQYGLLNPDVVAFSVVLNTTIGDFDYNWIGLLHAESGTLCMIAHTPVQQKIKTAGGIQGNNLMRTFAVEFDGAAAAMRVEVTADVWQIDFTARLAGMDESRRLLALDYYGEAAFLADGFRVSWQAQRATISPGVGYVGGLRVHLREPHTLQAGINDTIWIDASWQGTLTGAWQTVFTLTTTPKRTGEWTDDHGFRHYVVALGKITGSSGGSSTDLRPDTPSAQQQDALAEHERSRRHPDATLTEKGFAQYSSETDSSREDRAATPKAVKIAMDNAGARLAKARNGDDIPNKPLFIDNVGLRDTVNRAAAAVQKGGDTMTGKLTLPQISSFGINTPNALGGNSLTIGDNDTGIKQNGDGVLDVYSNGVHVFRFINGTLESKKNLKVLGDLLATGQLKAGSGSSVMAGDGNIQGSRWGGWLADYLQRSVGVTDVRLGGEVKYMASSNTSSWTHNAPAGCLYSGIIIWDVGSNSADNVGGVFYRPVQKLINGTWYNVASI
ncbi:phage tail protein [Escherichia coli]|nr:phage tail protein [Escherichia coli]EJY6221029.1 phage tail protein [Escherichia coli]EKP5580060.1 phage tail protein [Escherichia coli]ELK5008906.1 phage tail protein [Escherichia coli]ELN7510738.1 phage tail protein [Escherichia coli]